MKRAPAAAPAPAPSGTPSLAAGYLASLPLFLAYEFGLLLGGPGAARASAEQVAFAAFRFLGPEVRWVRLGLLALLTLAAVLHLRRGAGLEPRALARAAGLGILLGVALGPLLVLAHGWLAAAALAVGDPAPRALPRVLRLIGAAPWEEALFRVGAYACAYFVARRLLEFFGLVGRPVQAAAELFALLLSSLSFSAFHLHGVQAWLGLRGERFDTGLFLWRVSAGLLLGGLFRWRGLAVAAWSHAVFNLGLALGIKLL